MSKDQWINQVEDIVEKFRDGEIGLSSAIVELNALGMWSQDDIRKTLDPDGFLNIPEAYLK